jgi:hypothetical protein
MLFYCLRVLLSDGSFTCARPSCNKHTLLFVITDIGRASLVGFVSRAEEASLRHGEL